MQVKLSLNKIEALSLNKIGQKQKQKLKTSIPIILLKFAKSILYIFQRNYKLIQFL